MILNKQRGITIQVKEQGVKGSLNLTVHGYNKQEIYNHILFLFKSLEQQSEEVNIKFYKTKIRDKLGYLDK